MPESSNAAKWTAVAQLLRPQGRRGEILAEPLTDRAGVFVAGRTVRMAGHQEDPANVVPQTLDDIWHPQGRNAGRLVLKLAGVDSINAAEALGGRQLFVAESALPPLEEGTFLVSDLLGCVLFNAEQRVGVVTDIQFPIAADGHTRLTDAPDLLLVLPDTPPGHVAPLEAVLVPFVQAWLSAVDLGERTIRMTLPEGLLQHEAADLQT